MRNHFHLVLETPRANLVPGMKWLLGTYTMRFNHRHRLFGHLFSGRYKAMPVDNSGTGYLKSVCDYVPSQSRARQAGARQREAFSGHLEQLPAIPPATEFPSGVAQSRPIAGRARDSEGQPPGRKDFERRMEWRRHGVGS
jgi:putative transposase